jgi:hypothetical protein
MKCGFCGREIPDEPGREQSCGSCAGGCRKVHCPYCGYANPAVPALLKRWLKKKDDDQGGDA